MKTKQHLLFAALLISCFAAGSLANHSFNSANLSNSRTIKNANASPLTIDTGTLVEDVNCDITYVSKSVGAVTLGLTFSIADPESSKEYALCNLKDDTFVDKKNFTCDLPKLEYKVKLENGNVETRYGDILKTFGKQFAYDIVGPDNDDYFGKVIETKCVIEDFDYTKNELLLDDAKVLNLYDFKTGKPDLGSKDGKKFDRHYCKAIPSEEISFLDLKDFIDIKYKGSATFNGVGAASFNINNTIQPGLNDYRIDVLNEELVDIREETKKAKEEFDILDQSLTDDEKNIEGDLFGYKEAKSIYEGYLNDIETYETNIEKINSGVYKVREYIFISGDNNIIAYYEDGTTASSKCKETYFEITKENSTLTFYDKILNRKDILAVALDSFNINVRIFDTGLNPQGKHNNVFLNKFDLTDTFSANKFIIKDAIFESNGNKVTLNSTNANPYYIDCNLAFWLSALITAVVYELISVILFFYFKEKNKDDIFKRMRPKQYWKTNTMGLITVEVLLIALMSIIFRSTCIGNTSPVTNNVDILIVAFSIGTIIFVGYFIRYFAIQIKNIRDKRRNDKLKIGSDSAADDGTIAIKNK